jgi:RNA polymerase sigma-70 factor (ECF subfamily)
LDVEDFEQFFELMRPRLLRAATRSLDVETANEVAITTLHTLWTKNLANPSTVIEQRQLQALAYRVLDGYVRNAWRAQQRRSRLARAVAGQEHVAPRTVPDVADAVAERYAGESFARLMARLSPPEREVATLVMEGFKVGEIAELLGRSPGAISMRLNRARRRLEQELERREEHDTGT